MASPAVYRAGGDGEVETALQFPLAKIQQSPYDVVGPHPPKRSVPSTGARDAALARTRAVGDVLGESACQDPFENSHVSPNAVAPGRPMVAVLFEPPNRSR